MKILTDLEFLYILMFKNTLFDLLTQTIFNILNLKFLLIIQTLTQTIFEKYFQKKFQINLGMGIKWKISVLDVLIVISMQ